MRHPDVVVVGVGRTGTSFTAMILQMHFGVFMAHPDRMVTTIGEDSCLPIGSFEDKAMVSHTYKQVETPNAKMADWLKEYNKYFGGVKGLIGIKNTAMSLFSREQWEELAPRLIIRTHRPKELVVKSMERWRGRDTDWGFFYDRRENCMQENLDKHFSLLHIKYSYNRVLPENIITFLRPSINKLRGL